MHTRSVKHVLYGLVLTLALCAPAALAELRVHRQGAGPSLYLVGGGPAFATFHLQKLQDALQRRYRVSRWDMRGVGDNADVAVHSARPVLEQWLQDMAEELPAQPVYLWGHSWGALQVLLFAARHPQRVAGIVLSNPVEPDLESLEYIELRRYRHPRPQGPLTLEEYGTPAETRYQFHAKIASYFVDGRRGWDFAAQFDRHDLNGGLNVQVWDEYRAAPLPAQAVRRLAPKIQGVIYCRQDVLMPRNYQAYKQLLPDTEHALMEGCAHFPWEEKPREYVALLERLLGFD